MSSLFENDPVERKRERLRELGWIELPGGPITVTTWKRPGGGVVSEETAFKILAKIEAEE